MDSHPPHALNPGAPKPPDPLAAFKARKPGTPPERPLSTELWNFRNLTFTREKMAAAIKSAKMIDPKTHQPGEIPLPEPVVNYLLWILDRMEGDVFYLDQHVHSATPTDFAAHIHFQTVC
jgi:hypothetical protein